jgi:hypothetical protein
VLVTGHPAPGVAAEEEGDADRGHDCCSGCVEQSGVDPVDEGVAGVGPRRPAGVGGDGEGGLGLGHGLCRDSGYLEDGAVHGGDDAADHGGTERTADLPGQVVESGAHPLLGQGQQTSGEQLDMASRSRSLPDLPRLWSYQGGAVPDVRVSEARRPELRDRFDDLYAVLNPETALATRQKMSGWQEPSCRRARDRPARVRLDRVDADATADGRSGSVPAMMSLSGRRPSARRSG